MSVECCSNCEQPKSRTNVAGDEGYIGWPVCVNPDCVAYGENQASAKYISQDELDRRAASDERSVGS